MANHTGIKWNKGGKLSRRKLGRIDFRQFEDLAEELQEFGADLQTIFDRVMNEAGKEVQADTEKAMAESNLPAKGKYSTGTTKQSINLDPKVKWSGTVGSIGFGFDFDKPNAGRWLISGTPRMQPDAALEKIYTSNKYKSQLVKEMRDMLTSELNRLSGGGH